VAFLEKGTQTAVANYDHFPSIFQKISVFIDKSNLPVLFLRRFQKLTKHIRHHLELLIIFPLKLLKFGGELFLG